MKTIIFYTMIFVFLSANIGGVFAQTVTKKLDQVELMKQFNGTWKAEIGKDTIAVAEFKPFGTGLDGYVKVETKGATITEGRKLFGYDKKTDKFMQAELNKDTGFELWACWFVSENFMTGVPFDDISNPEKAVYRVDVVIKSPVLYVQTLFQHGKPIGSRTMHRK